MKKRVVNRFTEAVLILAFILIGPVFSLAENKSTDKVLAVVGKEKIMQSDILGKIAMMPPQFRSRYESEEAKKQLLDQIIKYNLLAQEARRLGINKKPEIKNRVEEIVNNIIIQELTKQEVADRIKVEAKEIEAYYNANPDKFTIPEKIKASLIFVAVEGDSDKQKKKEKADKLLNRLKQGEKIKALAKEFSDDRRTKKRGGSTGYFSRGRRLNSYGQAFEDRAFSLKRGEISDVIESKGGFYIIRLVDKKAQKKKSLDEVRDRIERSLKQSKQKEAYEKYIKSLTEKYSVQIMD